ncbi:MAG: ATP-binding cassette domain-containing protein [Gemmatimonadales bacterium]
MSDIAISIDGITYGNGSATFDLAVRYHQCVAVIGDEKSGVDFLCETVLGLRTPMAGATLLTGERLEDLAYTDLLARRRKVGYLPAGDGLMQNLSLRANVALPLRFGSRMAESEIDSRVGIILAALRVADAADQRPAMVSDEQRRRAAIARALAFDPLVLLLEQPFNGITQRAAAELLEVVRGGEHAKGSRRTVFITGQQLPDILRPRIETIYRIAGGKLSAEQEP